MSKKENETLTPEEELTKAPEEETAANETVGETAPPAEGSAEWFAEKVPIRLFKDGAKYKEDVFVAVNGQGYLIQRGIEVMVPRFVAQVLYQSMDQDAATAAFMEQESAAFQAETQRLGV